MHEMLGKEQMRDEENSVGGCVSWRSSWRRRPSKLAVPDEEVLEKQWKRRRTSHHKSRLNSCWGTHKAGTPKINEKHSALLKLPRIQDSENFKIFHFITHGFCDI